MKKPKLITVLFLINLGVLIIIFNLVPENQGYSGILEDPVDLAFKNFMAKHSTHLWLCIASLIFSAAAYLIVDSRNRYK